LVGPMSRQSISIVNKFAGQFARFGQLGDGVSPGCKW
jgi:hypothetical protein